MCSPLVSVNASAAVRVCGWAEEEAEAEEWDAAKGTVTVGQLSAHFPSLHVSNYVHRIALHCTALVHPVKIMHGWRCALNEQEQWPPPTAVTPVFAAIRLCGWPAVGAALGLILISRIFA